MAEPSCNCPICGWAGNAWEPVESRPGHFTRKKCARCGSYPRDRLVWLLLSTYSQELCRRKLKLIEFGEDGRAYGWKKTRFDYLNVDIKNSSSRVVDMTADHVMSSPRLHYCDAGLISYVLSMVESRSGRVKLMRQFHAMTTDSGRLMLFDDFDFSSHGHVQLAAESFFHHLRFGREILSEVEDAGWSPIVVEDYVDDPRQVSLELPFVLACKRSDPERLREWIAKTCRA
jgi:hypothetical protein